MSAPLTRQPFGSSTFARAAAERPGAHPVRAGLAAMGTGKNHEPPKSSAELIALRDADMAFWAGLPGAPTAYVHAKWADKIAAALRREAVALADAALDATEAAITRTRATLSMKAA